MTRPPVKRTPKSQAKSSATPSARKIEEAAAKYEVAKNPDPEPPSKISNADAKGRVLLGSKFANKLFRVSEQPDGNVLLEPVVAIHEREVWLYRNPEAMAMVLEGIRQSNEGKGVYLGSFAQYADIDIDDDEE